MTYVLAVILIRRGTTAALLAAVALGSSACGGGTSTVTVQAAPATQSSSGSTATQPLTVPTSTSTTATPRRGSEPGTAYALSSFRSPSGNIGCVIAAGIARCDIVRRSWSAPPRPASCPPQVDYGQGAEVGRSGSASLTCSGDTTLNPSSPTLPYGTASKVDGFLSISRSSGVGCASRSSGHGFAISVERYRLF